MSTLDRCIAGALVGRSSMALVLSFGGTFWTALWLGVLLNTMLTAVTLRFHECLRAVAKCKCR